MPKRPLNRERKLTDPTVLYSVDEAIWRGHTDRLAALPQVEPASWPGSVQSDCRAFGPEAALPRPSSAGPAAPQIGVVMMVKDEADIIGHNLAWLYYTGIRRFIVLDNGSTDATRAELLVFRSRNRDAELVILDDTRISYAQGIRTTGLMRLAVSLWPDLAWTFAIDADEFLIPSRGYQELLDLPGAIDAITLPKVIHFQARDQQAQDQAGPASGAPMLGMPLRSKPFKLPPKVACRSHVHRGVTDGNHRAVLLDGRMPAYRGALSLGLYLREFQNRSYEQFRRKIMNGGPAVLAGRADGSFEGGDHWITFYNVLQAHGPDGLRDYYRQHCMLEPGPATVTDPFPGAPLA